jgi:S-adenosyl-L-methionine hydrolase (adenosine-forming)
MSAVPSPLVTLTTDYGSGSGYPAQVKGVLLSAVPDLRIVDLSHGIPPFDLLAGALLLEACVPWYPPEAIHLAVVDPGVGTARRAVCVVDASGRRLVGPDNGLFTPFLVHGSKVFALSDEAVVPQPVRPTFHGRDLFAPVVAALAGGLDPARLGPAVLDPVRLEWPAAERSGGQVRGTTLSQDSFGNLVTSIREPDLGADVRRRRARRAPGAGGERRSRGDRRPGGERGRSPAPLARGGGPPAARRHGRPWRCGRPLLEFASGMRSTTDNKRKAARLHHEIPVAYRSLGSFLTDWATNISHGGLFINTRKPLPVGTAVKILIQLPGEPFPSHLEGKVTRVTEFDNSHNMVPGMGIEFTSLDQPRREELDRFVEKLRHDLEQP